MQWGQYFLWHIVQWWWQFQLRRHVQRSCRFDWWFEPGQKHSFYHKYMNNFERNCRKDYPTCWPIQGHPLWPGRILRLELNNTCCNTENILIRCFSLALLCPARNRKGRGNLSWKNQLQLSPNVLLREVWMDRRIQFVPCNANRQPGKKHRS